MRKEFIIDGDRFYDMEGFYCEIDSLFTKDLTWETGRNMSAFNDILRGGFGVHEIWEPIKITWKNFSKSRKDLGYEELGMIIATILDSDTGHDCIFEIVE